jgi:hypothetical protein
MRIQWLIGLMALAGCSDSDRDARPEMATHADASMYADANTHVDASMPPGPAADAGIDPAAIETLVARAVTAYDRALAQSCKCVVEAGGFATIDECLAPSASGPTWVPCGTMALAASGSPDALAIASCLADALDARADCLSQVSCDSQEQAGCGSGNGALQCAMNDPQLIVQLIQTCPDLGLLSRL